MTSEVVTASLELTAAGSVLLQFFTELVSFLDKISDLLVVLFLFLSQIADLHLFDLLQLDILTIQ